MNPYIIIDAWDFDGFASDCNGVYQQGLIGNNLRVKENGWLKVETSWGIEEFFPGDKIVILDIAASISEGKNPIDEINLHFLHEISHWAEEVHRPGKKHGPIWSAFLRSLLEANKK